ncbi:SpoIIE family protein phosphatase [Nonomuraea sp. SBT364]|uniref:SpoIIE family protein phosphatase n=1 Tax=Nonomuraea sp. SBT364 TaxID=1580530 RepID=UPI000ACA384C|nr:SpoIIE family protein phosphatase [Nonomuraea sp. SBT364]
MTRRDGGGSAPGAANVSSRLDEALIEAVFDAGAHIGIVYVLDESRRALRMVSTMGLPVAIARVWARIRTDDPVPISMSVRERRLMWFGDRESLARECPGVSLTLPYPFALATAPLSSGGAVWGGLTLAWPAGHAAGLTARQRKVIEDSCGIMGDLLRRASERGRPITAGDQPRILDPVGAHHRDPRAGPAALRSLDSLPEGYCHLDAEARVAFVTAQGARLLDVSPSELVGRRLAAAVPWLDDPVHEDQYRSAVISHQATRFTARRPDGSHLSLQWYPSVPGMTLRITPAEATPRAPVGDGDRPLRTAGLHEMLHLAVSLARAMSAQDVIDLVADHVVPVYGAQALAILTWESGRMRVVAARGYSRELIEEFDGRPALRQVSPTADHDPAKPSFYATRDELYRAYPDLPDAATMEAWAVLSLVTSGRPIGTCVLAFDRTHRFSGDERAAFTALGGLIAQAFERAWLYDNKHQLAQSMQASLLPHTLPEIPGLEVTARYVPATPGMDIGGDFYDLIRLSDTEAAAVIGDVQGHDMTAAALMGQVRTAIRTHSTTGATCGEVLAHTNRLMAELAPDRFTSCLYLTLDLDRRTACLACAGHPPPLISCPGAPTRVVGLPPGLLLGIDPGAEYTTVDLDLPPGSVLTLYTDGLIEEPGLDLGEAIAGLAARFTPAPHRRLGGLADSLIGPATEERLDDTAVLLLRTAPPA